MSNLKPIRLSVLTVLFLCLTVALTSCSKKDVVSDEPIMSGGVDSGGDAGYAAGGSSESIAAGGGGSSALQAIFFDYDAYNIRGDARSALEANADWLRQNPSSTIQIEGHCDERGTIEYNLALGEKRAAAVRKYLQRLGIDASRISTISYGEERPASSGTGESAWSANRRAEFVVLSQ